MIGWFDLRSRLAAAEAQIVALIVERDDASERYSNATQNLGAAEAQVRKMTIMRDPATVDEAGLCVAREIEDLFVRGSPGGRTQRLANVQVLIIGAVQDAIRGERDYSLGWRKMAGGAP